MGITGRYVSQQCQYASVSLESHASKYEKKVCVMKENVTNSMT
jgi:hypothetical protein